MKEPRWLPAAVAAPMILFVALAVTSLIGDSQTSDEAIHLAAGFAHLTRADFAVNPEHPPLAKELAALPLLFMNVTLPVDDPSWAAAHASAFQLPLGERFLYHNGASYRSMLIAGRLPIVALGVLLCLTVYHFSRRLFGWQGGLLSLWVCALDPNILAHARLITTDLAVSLFLLLTLFFLHHSLTADVTARDRILTGVAAGLTLAAKYSAVIVLPAVAVVMLAATPRARAGMAAKAFAVVAAVALGTLALTYAVAGLPTYASGLAGVFTTVTGGSEAYLLGSVSDKGWWYYYPVAVALKTPVPTLVLLAVIPFAGFKRDHLALWIPLALFAAASLASARNVGLRHVLPLYPILFVLAGGAAALLTRGRVARAAAVAGGLWLAGSTLFIHPSYLAYFNEVGGGPANGSRLLSDSNIDWGQDFIRLKALMEREAVSHILLGWYGNQDPALYGIAYQYLPSVGHIHPPDRHLVPPGRTLLAVSAMTLQGMFQRDREAYAWLRQRRPLAVVGWSIFVYDLTADGESFQRLAGLYDRSRMPAHAAWARDRLTRLGFDGGGLTAPGK